MITYYQGMECMSIGFAGEFPEYEGDPYSEGNPFLHGLRILGFSPTLGFQSMGKYLLTYIVVSRKNSLTVKEAPPYTRDGF